MWLLEVTFCHVVPPSILYFQFLFLKSSNNTILPAWDPSNENDATDFTVSHLSLEAVSTEATNQQGNATIESTAPSNLFSKSLANRVAGNPADSFISILYKLEIQPLNLNAWYGLILTFNDSDSKTEEQYYELAKVCPS